MIGALLALGRSAAGFRTTRANGTRLFPSVPPLVRLSWLDHQYSRVVE
jgi:hypothetical protein